jgi:hypothetical protein
MALKYRKTTRVPLRVSLNLFLFTLATLWLNPISALVISNTATLPTLADFSKTVQNGQKDVLRGVYVDKALALPVVQPPSGDTTYVSNKDGEVTEFSMASNVGNVGLLAHNNKAGRSFSQLMVGREVQLVYGDGHVETFVIKKVLRFQALQPTSTYSSFKNLDQDEILSAEQMFNRVYLGGHHMTFQTCIEADGKSSWGRLFVIAVPKRSAQMPHNHSH